MRFVIAAALVTVALVGRADAVDPEKLTRENYDKVKLGMLLKEVEEILGPGERRYFPGEYMWHHCSVPCLIRVSMFEGKVAAKWQAGLGGRN